MCSIYTTHLAPAGQESTSSSVFILYLVDTHGLTSNTTTSLHNLATLDVVQYIYCTTSRVARLCRLVVVFDVSPCVSTRYKIKTEDEVDSWPAGARCVVYILHILRLRARKSVG